MESNISLTPHTILTAYFLRTIATGNPVEINYSAIYSLIVKPSRK